MELKAVTLPWKRKIIKTLFVCYEKFKNVTPIFQNCTSSGEQSGFCGTVAGSC